MHLRLLALCLLIGLLAPGWSCGSGKQILRTAEDSNQAIREIASGTKDPGDFKVGGDAVPTAIQGYKVRDAAKELGDALREGSDWVCPAVELKRTDSSPEAIVAQVQRNHAGVSREEINGVLTKTDGLSPDQVVEIVKAACKGKEAASNL